MTPSVDVAAMLLLLLTAQYTVPFQAIARHDAVAGSVLAAVVQDSSSCKPVDTAMGSDADPSLIDSAKAVIDHDVPD